MTRTVFADFERPMEYPPTQHYATFVIDPAAPGDVFTEKALASAAAQMVGTLVPIYGIPAAGRIESASPHQGKVEVTARLVRPLRDLAHESVRVRAAVGSGVEWPRVQLRRAKGWRKPDGVIVVARPGLYGNPFRAGVPFCGPTIRTLHSRADLVTAFRDWIGRDTLDPHCWDRDLIVAHVRLKAALDAGLLAGHRLACWCPLSEPCHADVLLDLANPEVTR